MSASRAEHCAAVPPLEPAQLHDHGPLPLTAEAVPALQRLAVGALVRLAPFEEPHAPLTEDGGCRGGRQRGVERPGGGRTTRGEALNLLGRLPNL